MPSTDPADPLGPDRLDEEIRQGIRDRLDDLIATGDWNPYRGKYVNRVEALVAEGTGRTCLATNSATSALELALRAAGIGPGDEVIVPASTFVATAQAVLMAGATPVLAGVDPGSWNLTATTAQACHGPRTTAVVFVDLFGNATGIPEVARWSRTHGLFLLEDAAQAAGGHLGDSPTGTQGDAAAYSFNECKPFSCGDGGMLLARDPALADRARAIRHAGLTQREDGRFVATSIGGKMLMTEFQAAVLVPQLERMASIRDRRAGAAAALLELAGTRLGAGCAAQTHDPAMQSIWQRVVVAASDAEHARRALAGPLRLERFYVCALPDEPVVAARAVIDPEVAAQSRDLFDRMVGWTLHPFDDMRWIDEIRAAAPR